jgi:hypothetical protein
VHRFHRTPAVLMLAAAPWTAAGGPVAEQGLTAHTFTTYDGGVDFHDAGGMHGGVVFSRPPPGRVGPP